MTKINGGKGPDGINPRDPNFKGKNTHESELEKLTKEINDLGNNPTDYIGRSQVRKYEAPSFNGEALDPKLIARLQGDLSALKQNPELLASSDVFFEGALAQAKKDGYADPYARAVELQRGYVNEFGAKENA